MPLDPHAPDFPPNVSVEHLPPKPTSAGYRESGQHDGSALRITIRWYKPSCYVALVMGVFFSIAPLLFQLRTGQPLVLWGWLLFLAFGLPFFYGGLTLRTNRTEVLATGKELRIWHGPLPTFSSPKRRLSTELIDQLYCTKENVGQQTDSWRFKLFIRLESGELVEVIDKIDTPDSLLYIEQQLESYLGITDRAEGVEDELRQGDRLVQEALESRDV